MITQGATFVRPSDTARDAARRMRDLGVGFLPVCDSGGRVIGGVTARDMAIRLIAEDHPATTHIREVMTHEYPTCLETDDGAIAARRMAESHQRPVLVTDAAGLLRGVIAPTGSAALC
jgi:CBS domain-containing protein